MKCPSCGREIPQGQNWCRMCQPESWEGFYENEKEAPQTGKGNRHVWEDGKDVLPERPENSNSDGMWLARLEWVDPKKQKEAYNPVLQPLALARPVPMTEEERRETAVVVEESAVPEVRGTPEVPKDQEPVISYLPPKEPGIFLTNRKVVMALGCVLALTLAGAWIGWVLGGRQTAGEYEDQMSGLTRELEDVREEAEALQSERDKLAEEQEALLSLSETLAAGDELEALELADAYSDLLPGDLLSGVRGRVYEAGKASYLNGDKNQAEEYFSVLGDWSRSADYLDLIRMERDGVDESDYDRLVEIVDLPNASALLFADEDMSLTYLEGEWETGTLDDYYFKMVKNDEGGHTASYNLPSFDLEGYFYLEDGVYAVGTEKETAVDYFRFTAAGKNDLEVYCYKDGQTYTLHRA